MRVLSNGDVILERGDRGSAVPILQQVLLDSGFSPGNIDGDYGGGTEAAVRAFQASRNLFVDGVAGPFTQRRLGVEAEVKAAVPGPAAAASTGLSRGDLLSLFPSADPSEVMERYREVFASLLGHGLGDAEMQAMALGTIAAETGRFEPIDEYPSRYNTPPGGAKYSLYDYRTDIGNNNPGDGARYRGRGYVQLTGRTNYVAMERALGESLVQAPSRANEPKLAAEILATFLKEREGRIRSALGRGDLRRARRVVNGGSHGLDRFTRVYRAALKLLSESPETMDVSVHG